MAPHGSRQPDIDLAGLVADDVDGAAGEPLVEQSPSPSSLMPRMPLAQGVKKLFPRQREDRRSGRGRISGHGLFPTRQSILTKFGMLLPAARVCPRLVPQASDALPGLGRAVHHQRDKSGQCEGRREEANVTRAIMISFLA